MWSQCRKCGAGKVLVGKWQPPEQVGKGKGVLPSNMEPVKIQTEMVAVYGADVMSFQQLWKWGDFANGHNSILQTVMIKCGTVYSGEDVAYTVPHCAPNVLDTKSTVNVVHENCRYRRTSNRNVALLICSKIINYVEL